MRPKARPAEGSRGESNGQTRRIKSAASYQSEGGPDGPTERKRKKGAGLAGGEAGGMEPGGIEPPSRDSQQVASTRVVVPLISAW